MFIELVTNNVKYNLIFPGDKRVIYLTGDSSTGKTALLSIKESIAKQGKSRSNPHFITDGISYIKSDKILVTPEIEYLEYEITHKNTDEYLFVLDEDDVPFTMRRLKSLIELSNSSFILITRDFLIKDFNIDVSTVYFLEKVNEVIIAKEYFVDTVLTDTPNIVICEDSTEGYALPRLVLGDSCSIIKAKGKSNVINEIKKIYPDSNNILLDVDRVAFAYEYSKILLDSSLQGLKFSVSLKESFEEFVLVKVLKQDILFDNKYVFSKESRYTIELNKLFKQHSGMCYIKGGFYVMLLTNNMFYNYAKTIPCLRDRCHTLKQFMIVFKDFLRDKGLYKLLEVVFNSQGKVGFDTRDGLKTYAIIEFMLVLYLDMFMSLRSLILFKLSKSSKPYFDEVELLYKRFGYYLKSTVVKTSYCIEDVYIPVKIDILSNCNH